MMLSTSTRSISRVVARRAVLALPQSRLYHDNIVDHYENPRNVGSLDKKDHSVGTVRILRDASIFESLVVILYIFILGNWIEIHTATKERMHGIENGLRRGNLFRRRFFSFADVSFIRSLEHDIYSHFVLLAFLFRDLLALQHVETL